MKLSRISSILCLAVALLCGHAAGQESGSITGQVLDPAGAVIVGAKITVKNEAIGAIFNATSDQTGLYRAPQLLPGTYTLTTSAPGFRTLAREGVIVQVNDRLRVDLILEVGQMADTVTVQGVSPLLQTEDATAGQVINTQKILDLPLNSRNWLQLATLAAGTVTYPGVVDTSAGNSQSIGMNLGGARYSQANFILDGTDNTNFTSAGAVAYPPVDSLQEFKVETNNYTADVGRLGGPVVNATIKSGSNSLHGTAYDFLRNRELNARNFFASPTAHKPEFTRNQLGASAGAPVIRNKLFFFLNYEGNRQRQDQIVTTQVFTAAQKTGNFASQLGGVIGQDSMGRPVNSGEIFDPYSVNRLPSGAAIRDPFPGNIIPTSRLNPVSAKLAALMPGPNTSGSPNFTADLSNPLDIDTFAGRVDLVHSTKDMVFGHFVYSDQNVNTAPIFPLPLDGNTGMLNLSNDRQLGVGWTHVFSPTSLSEFRIGYVRNLRLALPSQSDVDVNAQFGIPLPYPGNGVGGLANMAISGYTTLGTAAGTFKQIMNKYELVENYTLIRGPHTFKFGVQAQTKLFENDNSCNNCRGVYSFNGVYTQQIGFSNTGSAVADFLTGVINTANYANVRNATAVGHDLDLYAQDKWSINRKLTVSVGVRYQYHPPSDAKQGATTNAVWGPGFTNPTVVVGENLPENLFLLTKNVLLPYVPVVRSNDLGLTQGLVHGTHGEFAPRLGIAYQLTNKTVLRTGYGIFYGFLDASSGGLAANPPGNLGISTSGNTIDPTLVLGNATFGSNPFNQALLAPAFIATRDPNWKPEFTQMYNLSLQHQFAGNWLVEVGFMGNDSSRLSITINDNDAAPVPPSNTTTPQSRRRVSTFLGDLPCYCPQGYSNYEALTLNVEKRLSSGLTLLTNFTWSRALGFAPPLYWGINSASILDPTNLSREYGPLEFDIEKRFVVSYTYDLPFGTAKRFGSGASPILDRVIGGWQLSGITTLQGGFPFTPTLSTSLGKTFTNSRPDAIGNPTASPRQPYDWINPAAFAIPSTAEVAAGYYFGNAGRGSIREPGLVNFDFSVIKNTAIRETIRLQFRAELYNFTNTPFFGGNGFVNNNFNSPSFGKVTQAGDPRVVQLGLKLIF